MPNKVLKREYRVSGERIRVTGGFCTALHLRDCRRKCRVENTAVTPYVSHMSYPEDIQDMIDDFAFLTDWEERYMHVIDMGKSLPPLDTSEKTDAHKVKGCVSQVWLVSRVEDGKLHFRGDSDAHIVKGLVAVVLQIFSGRRPAEILALDASAILGELDLAEHLSPQRSNGLKAMIERILSQARALENS
ncbi:SufE family protein [Litorimonas sp. RW-G-Af-16]|uniref:SufE family protein n=1 Tax=Litorimonas sp. RW-G-Af-16 TaxID=3241168 RepID=UPI00390C6AA3